MAKQPQPDQKQQDSLLREVDEALRADKLAALWQQSKQPLLYAVIAILVLTAANSIWRHFEDKKAAAAMTRLDAAISGFQGGGRADAAKEFGAIAEDMSGERRDVALLWQAKAYEAMGQEKDAIAPLTEVAKGHSGDLLWRDLACLRLMGLTDEVPASCSSGDNSPLRALRDEWRAGQLWQTGKVKEARALLSVIANGDDANVTDAQRDRAAALLTILNEDKAKKE